MVFTLPSLPSGLSSLLDTSPPVFYPAPPAQTQSKRVQSQSIDSPRRDRETSSPIAGPSRLHARGREESPLPLPVSVSANDVSGIWQPLPSRNREAARHRQRRLSLAGPAGGLHANDVSDTEIDIDPFLLPGTRSHRNGTPTRPAHRRSQSAVPFPVLGSESSTQRSGTGMGKVVRPGSGHEPGPMGRLHEFSRNSLASISAVSLPTLAELESDVADRDRKDQQNEGIEFPRRYGAGVGRSIPSSPLVRPHDRRSSKASPILGPTSPTRTPPSDLAQLGHSPSECDSSLGLMVDLAATMSISSVPPPAPAQAQAQYQSMPITHAAAAAASPTRRHRPPLSPRSWTFQDINQPFATRHDRRASIDSNSSVSLSDVNVLAKWSFPSSPSPGKKPSSDLPDVEAPRGRQPGPSDRLRERLRSLSALDTASLPASSSAPSISGVSATRSDAGQSLSNAHINGSGGGGGRAGPIKPSRPLPSYLTSNHRHTHSSPNILQIPGIGCITPPSQNQNKTQQTQLQLQLQPKGSMGPPLFPPPPRPQRRPTTSRLRQPTPLSMPIRPSVGRHISHTSLISLSGVGGAGSRAGLSSSPGSMVSDSSSNLCPSPTSSVKSLPVSISSTDLILSDIETNNHSNGNNNGRQEQQKSGKGKAWWAIPMPALGRSRSRNSTKSDQDGLSHIHTQVKEVTVTTYGSGSENGDSRREEEDEEEETFIDMDQM